MNTRLLALCRYAFYLSALLFFYGTLFPFRFDFSCEALQQAWRGFGFVPFWDVERSRIHSLPDMVGNLLLTVPLGFFGYLWYARERGLRTSPMKWFLMGLFLGLLAESIQLAIPSRMSGITDALNNGLGALAGAVFASLFGSKILALLSGSLLDEKHTVFVVLVGIAVALALLPFDFGLDVSHLRSSAKHLLLNPWESGNPIQDEYVQIAVYALIGAVAGLIRTNAVLAAALFLPVILESFQLLVESHSPSLRDPVLSIAGTAVGIGTAWLFPAIARPATGFIVVSTALAAAGLSPYHFATTPHFEWIPLVEYYRQTTGIALYDAMAGILSYGLLAALRPRKTTILLAIALAAGIEFAQMFLPTRSAGTTDIVIAAIGAWAGYSIAYRGKSQADAA